MGIAFNEPGIDFVKALRMFLEEVLFSLLFQKKFHGLDRMQDYHRQKDELLSHGLLTSYRLNDFGYEVSSEWLQAYRKSLCRQIQWGVRFVFPGHLLYPAGFHNLSEPPFLLSFVGSPIWLTGQGLSVVGSRDADTSSLQWMEQNLSELVRKMSIYLVSGGARGVDQKAHAICLLQGAPTLVLLPSGLGDIYPPSLQNWVKPILANGGAFISEYEFSQPMRKHFFQARNRLISALGLCTLIVQARRQSGTLITGRQAIVQGRPVLVVPSHPLDIAGQGGLDLLMEGATPVRDSQDLEIILNSEISVPSVGFRV